MRCYRLFVAILLALFCAGTVQAASMGVAMQLTAAQDAAMAHCHDLDDDRGDSHAQSPHGKHCQSCPACVPMLMAATGVLIVPDMTAAQLPHREGVYASIVVKLHHRPPISA